MLELKHEKVLETSMKGYFFWKFLGQGSTAKVYLALNENTLQKVAIKVIPKAYLNSDKKIYELVKTQIYILKNHKNENIVKCFDVFQSPSSIFIVTQYCDSIDLQHYLKSKKYLSEDNAVMFLRQILNGFKGLHQLNMMHRDFKLANILLNTNKVCKIADLGFAKKMEEGSLAQSILGTYITMAPQVIEGRPYGLQADIWSIGVVFYQMISGQYPFRALNEKLLLKTIKTKKIEFNGIQLSRECEDFIKSCLEVDVSKRITWPQIYKHPLIVRKRMQLIYGIFLPKIDYEESEKFYYRKTEEFENPQIFSLDSSYEYSRKAFIDGTVQEKAANGRQSFQVFRSSASYDENRQAELKCAKKYIMYLNSISHPCKFLTRRLLNTLSLTSFDNLNFLQMIYNKVEQSLKEYDYIVKHRINLFKIKNNWEQFVASKSYSVVKTLIERNIEKVNYSKHRLDKKIDKKLIKQIEKTSSESANSKLSKAKSAEQFSSFQSQTIRVLKLFKELINKTSNESQLSNQLKFVQALLFYLHHQGRTAEQFDLSLARKPQSLIKTRQYLLKKIENQIQLKDRK